MHALTPYMRSGFKDQLVAPKLSRHAHHTTLSGGNVPVLNLEESGLILNAIFKQTKCMHSRYT